MLLLEHPQTTFLGFGEAEAAAANVNFQLMLAK